MSTSAEDDSESVKRDPLLVPVVDAPVGVRTSQGFWCRSPPLQHQVPHPPTAANSSSTQLRLQGPTPLSVAWSKKAPTVGSSWTGVGPRSGRSQVTPASRNGGAAIVAKIQRPEPIAGVDSSSSPGLFEEFRYIPCADRTAKDQAMAACRVKARCCRQLFGTMATKGSVVQKKQEAGSSAATISCPVGEVCHGYLCDHPMQGKEPSPQMYIPQSCDASHSPFDKFLYTPLAEQKHQEQCGSAWRSSSVSTAIRGPSVGRKKMQLASQQAKLEGFAEKRRKGAQKPNNKKAVSQQKRKRMPSAVLTAAEKQLDMYRRLPPDQLVAPRRTPYNLLQESYAPDPWKVMVICMLLNRTKGEMVKQFVEEFFTLYPDAQTACNADLAGMAEYLRPTGLQLEKAVRIQKFSSSYLSSDWNYVTELHGVGKYAADAYAIFCAGRVMDVQPDDHKLVDYWKYVCNIGEPWEDEDSCFAI